jgi:hypothetical protein
MILLNGIGSTAMHTKYKVFDVYFRNGYHVNCLNAVYKLYLCIFTLIINKIKFGEWFILNRKLNWNFDGAV